LEEEEKGGKRASVYRRWERADNSSGGRGEKGGGEKNVSGGKRIKTCTAEERG